jgi:hypothetical protein
MCLADGPPITSFTVDAELSSPQSAAALTAPNVAESPIFSCPVSAAPCMPTMSVSQPPPPTAVTPPRHCTLNRSILRRGPRLTRVRLRLRCAGANQPAARVRILLEPLGRRSRRLIATVGVRDGRWRRLTIPARLHRGDRLVFRVPADRSAGLRAFQDTLTA